MKFGKLSPTDLAEVDFSLPPLSEASKGRLEAHPPCSKPRIYFGATGWGMPEWVGSYYPPKTPRKQFLQEYAKQFNSLEFNSTHYRIPSIEQVRDWRAQVPAAFRFGPKIPQRISHSRDLDASDKHTSRFCAHIAELSDNLGHCFLQLPPYFATDRLPLLEAFLKRFPVKDIPLALEFRHPSWFEDRSHGLFDLLAERGYSAVLTDVAGRRDVLHQELCGDTLVWRFVGNDLHPSDFQRLDAWIERLDEWLQQGLRQIYAFLHEPDNIRVPELATYFVKKANARWGLDLKAPQLYQNPQQELF